MSTFYLDRTNSELSLENGVLIIRSGEDRRVVPIALLKRLVIAAKTRLDTALLLRLAEQGVTVVMFDPRCVDRRAYVFGVAHGDARVRLRQYQASTDEQYRLAAARRWIVAKLRRHLHLLGAVTSVRADCRAFLRTAMQHISTIQALATTANSLPTLRGLEGNAAQAFFAAYQKLFAPALGFAGRKKRPPPDPVNATLSLAYTLLHARAVQLAWAAGLDPSVGFYHEPAWGRESLACDLIEPWRPCVDGWVYEWFHSRYLEADHFKRQGEGCFLGKAGRAKFFAAFERQIAPVERALRLQCRALVKTLMEESYACSVSERFPSAQGEFGRTSA